MNALLRPTPRDHACPIRDVLDRIGDAWSLLVLLELSKGPCRFNALARVVDGISPRMLSVTLRHLTRDGFVAREVLPTTPPQVDYALTPLGRSLVERVDLLQQWAVAHQPEVRRARAAFDSVA